MNYYPFHIGDYASATRHLSWDEDCAYRRLLDVYYTSEKPLPAELRAVCRLAMATTDAQREAVQIVLEEFFTLTSEGWVNCRADAELHAMREKQQKQRDKANKRWQKPAQECGNASAMPRHEESDAVASKKDADAVPPTPTPTPTPTLNSVPDGTDGAAVQPADMPKDELWKAGKSLLAQSGMPAAQCGSFVGKLVKDYGDQIVVDAVRAAVVERPADAPSFLKAACQRAAGTRPAAGRKPSSHMGLASQDYTAGVNLDGTFA